MARHGNEQKMQVTAKEFGFFSDIYPRDGGAAFHTLGAFLAMWGIFFRRDRALRVGDLVCGGDGGQHTPNSQKKPSGTDYPVAGPLIF
jgi:hypothetical protein